MPRVSRGRWLAGHIPRLEDSAGLLSSSPFVDMPGHPQGGKRPDIRMLWYLHPPHEGCIGGCREREAIPGQPARTAAFPRSAEGVPVLPPPVKQSPPPPLSSSDTLALTSTVMIRPPLYFISTACISRWGWPRGSKGRFWPNWGRKEPAQPKAHKAKGAASTVQTTSWLWRRVGCVVGAYPTVCAV